MVVKFEFEYWQAVRLKTLVKLGYNAMRFRDQIGIDGITRSELNELAEILDKLKDSPQHDVSNK